MPKNYLLEGINIHANMSTINICNCIEHGIKQLEIILEIIDLKNQEDSQYFKDNLDILKRFYEKLDRDLYNNIPHIDNIRLPDLFYNPDKEELKIVPIVTPKPTNTKINPKIFTPKPTNTNTKPVITKPSKTAKRRLKKSTETVHVS